MPLRGETIGVAYVRVLADGSGLGKSIDDAFDDQEKHFEKQGKESGEQFNEGFNKEFMKDFGQQLRDALDKKEMKDFEREWRTDMNKIEKNTTRNIKVIDTNFRKMDATLNRSAELVAKGQEDWVKFNKEQKRTGTFLRKTGDAFDTLGDRVGKGFGRGARNNFVNLFGAAARAPFALMSTAVTGLAKGMETISSMSGGILRFFGSSADTAGGAAKTFTTVASAPPCWPGCSASWSRWPGRCRSRSPVPSLPSPVRWSRWPR
jgi:hypothetical protein